MTNEQKTMFLLKTPYINLFKLQKTYKQNINLIGGDPKDYNKEYDNNTGKFNIDIDKNKYYYRVERYSTNEGTKYEDKDNKFIDFITIKDKYKQFVDCGSISINIKNKTASITSLGNSPKCLRSTNNVKFKYGDTQEILSYDNISGAHKEIIINDFFGYILFQIMLFICKKENLKEIELTDNSNRKCGDIDLSLDYLKTLTHGFPHYHKYGFKFKNDEDNKILNDNYKNYQNDPKITKNKLLSLLKNNNIDKKIIESINKVLAQLQNDEISIKKIVKLYTLDLDNVEYCDFIHKIYIQLYKQAGYKPYYTKDYVLNLK